MNRFSAFLKSRGVLLVTAVLAVQAAAFYAASNRETEPRIAPLNAFPERLGPWESVQDGQIDEYTRAILQPDDFLLRAYRSPASSGSVQILVAYFRSQRTGHAPHSPRNCLPGHGWVANRGGKIDIGGGIGINRSVIAKEGAKAVVLYWYQTFNRVVADEYSAKLFLVLDGFRYGRTDTALVRVLVPFQEDREQSAEQSGVEFSRIAHRELQNLLRTSTPTD